MVQTSGLALVPKNKRCFFQHIIENKRIPPRVAASMRGDQPCSVYRTTATYLGWPADCARMAHRHNTVGRLARFGFDHTPAFACVLVGQIRRATRGGITIGLQLRLLAVAQRAGKAMP